MKKIEDFIMVSSLVKRNGAELFWKKSKEYYLTLKTDEEKQKFLAKLFQGMNNKKEG